MSISTPHRIGPKRSRDLQRIAHLVAGLALVAYVYFTPGPGTAAESTIRWLLAPALIASGMAMWQWPRIRRMLRQRKVRQA